MHSFPDGVDGEEYSLLRFTCDRIRYYNATAGDIYDSRENEDRKIYHAYYGK